MVSVDVQGYIIELLTGMDAATFIRKRIFEPLGMDETMDWVPASEAGRFASVHTHDEEGNLIAYSTFDGVNGGEGVLIDSTSVGNSVLGNSIHSNERIGIDLNTDLVTINDLGDLDGGLTIGERERDGTGTRPDVAEVRTGYPVGVRARRQAHDEPCQHHGDRHRTHPVRTHSPT